MSEPAIIKVRDNGPYLVQRNVKLIDAQGREIDTGDRDDFVLCRCGHSARRPFCDGAHKAAGFRAVDSAP